MPVLAPSLKAEFVCEFLIECFSNLSFAWIQVCVMEAIEEVSGMLGALI